MRANAIRSKAMLQRLPRILALSAIGLSGLLAPLGCSSSTVLTPISTTLGEGGPTSEGSFDASAEARDAAKDAGRDADAGDASACLDERLDGGPEPSTKCPKTGPCAVACERLVPRYKAGVATAAATCIANLRSCTSAPEVLPCVDLALGRACADPTAAPYCTPLVTACDPNAGGVGSIISQSGCESFAIGMSASGRAAFASCIQSKIASGTCAKDVGSCADEVRQ
jgi:hypothetical protein